MADYYPLISRAIAGVEPNTGENRRSLYKRARNALFDQLRSVTPPRSETDITRERLALEEAIRKIESDVARRMREEAPRPSERLAPRPRPGQDDAPPGASPAASFASGGSDLPPPPPESRPAFGRIVGRPDMTAADLRRFRRPAPAESKPSESAVSERARAPAQAELAPVPAALPEPHEPSAPVEVKERNTLRFAGFGLAARKRPEAAPADAPDSALLSPDRDVESAEHAGRDLAETRVLELPLMFEEGRPRPTKPRQPVAPKPEGSGLKRFVNSFIGTIVVAIVLIGIVGGALVWQRNAIKAGFVSLLTLAHGPSTQAPRDTSPVQSKIPDQVGQAAPATQSDDTQAQAAPSAQHVVFYEEDPNGNNGSKRYEGTVTWSLENLENNATGPGQPMDKAIRGDIVIPERNITATFTIRRNKDNDLPASHTASVAFTLPPDFSHGGIQEIRALMMKQSESTPGVALAGLSVKVTTGIFLVGLSASEGEVQRNIQMLKERDWFDIAILYNDNRRAIMAVEKGSQGDRVFADAFAAWGQ